MRYRRIAIMIDGGFFLKRLKTLLQDDDRVKNAEGVASLINLLCRNHVAKLTGCAKDKRDWLDHAYRIFFYDAWPYDKNAHNPISNRQIDFSRSDEAIFRKDLFHQLRRTRKVALRLGKVIKEDDWSPPGTKIRKILPTRDLFAAIQLNEQNLIQLTPEQAETFNNMQRRWAEIEDYEIRLRLRQKGVDMRIGIDIASVTLKKQVDTIVLVSGDSDFVPAAKLARREGVEFILDPLWQNVNEDLFEHIDGLQSGLRRPGDKEVDDE